MLLCGPTDGYTRIKAYRVMWKREPINLGREGKLAPEEDHGEGVSWHLASQN